MTNLDDETLACMNAFLSAAADVLRLTLRQAAADTPGALAVLQRMAAGNGVMAVTASAGAGTGMAQVHVQIAPPDMPLQTLLLVELQADERAQH